MQTELSQFTAIIGIDWADKKHDVCIQDMKTGRRHASQVRHRAEELDEWARSLHRRYGGPIAVALELSKGPIVSVLQKYDFFVIFPIDPTTLANHRKTFTLSGAKDDPTDAEYILDLLLKHTEHFKALKPQSVEMRALMTLVEQRRRLMNDRVRPTNRLRNALKQHYPPASGSASALPHRSQSASLCSSATKRRRPTTSASYSSPACSSGSGVTTG